MKKIREGEKEKEEMSSCDETLGKLFRHSIWVMRYPNNIMHNK